MQLKSDRDAADSRRMLKINRQNIRSQFALAASGLEEYGREFTDKNVTGFIGAAIEQIDGNIRKIRESHHERSAVCQSGKILGLVPKTYLPNYREFQEKRWFTSVNDLALNPFRIFENSCSFLLKSSLKSLPVMILQRIGFSS